MIFKDVNNMETKQNIAEILRDKPQGTKLYSLTYGDCSYQEYTGDFGIECQSQNGVQFNLNEYGRCCIDGECILFPSKSMRDWSKFACKKGDVLVSKGRRTLHVIFEGFNDDTYTTFKGKHYICGYSDKEDYDEEYYNDYHKEVKERTIEFEKDNVNNAQTYINIIEKRLGDKLNRETLEIEKQSEFKRGNIAFADYGNRQYVFIVSGITDLSEGYDSFISLDLRSLTLNMGHRMSFFKENLSKLRLATEEEKQQLFDALAKEGKAWDAEKKQIEDSKSKVELKPFGKVLVRDSKSDYWRATLFSHIDKNGCYYCVWASWNYCIPYEGNESLLGTNKDVEG